MLIVKALIALVVGAIVYFLLKPITAHFAIDIIWAYIVAVIAGLGYYFYGPQWPTRA